MDGGDGEGGDAKQNFVTLSVHAKEYYRVTALIGLRLVQARLGLCLVGLCLLVGSSLLPGSF